jgi:UDP-glucose 6-dehydrogenase
VLPEDPAVAVVGIGHVGTATASLFPSATLYDPFRPEHAANRDAVNLSDVAIVCVPTPANPDGSADLDAVNDVFSWLDTPWVVVRSTLPPGTTEGLRARRGRPVVFWPAYFGEWKHAVPWEHSVHGWPFVLLGGQPEDTGPLVPWLATVFGADRTYRQGPARMVELCKYMENAWLASQVLFATEFSRIAGALDVDYWELREMWALDPRVSRHHTAVYGQTSGYAGRCLPKDMAAIIEAATGAGYDARLLRLLVAYNQQLTEPPA